MEALQTLLSVLFEKGGRPKVVVTAISIFSFWVFMAWSLGLAPAFGSGFARAEDVQSIQSQLLENAIIEARIRYCSAPNGTPSKQFFLKETNKKAKEYKDLNGVAYQLPLCEELIVASN